MKFAHISDLHLGKRVHQFSMIEDQNYILDKIQEHNEKAKVIFITPFYRNVYGELDNRDAYSISDVVEFTRIKQDSKDYLKIAADVNFDGCINKEDLLFKICLTALI